MIKSLQGVLQITVTFLLSYIVPLIHYLESFVPKMKIRFFGFICFVCLKKNKKWGCANSNFQFCFCMVFIFHRLHQRRQTPGITDDYGR